MLDTQTHAHFTVHCKRRTGLEDIGSKSSIFMPCTLNTGNMNHKRTILLNLP